MNNIPDVSIIMPNYNGARYVINALSSVRAQTLRNWECIIIDDGSTDNSISLIRKFIKSDSRFQLIKLPHGGVSIARNAGLDIARGKYIAFLDSDDCYTDFALEMLLHIANATGADMVGGMAFIVPADFKFVPMPIPNWNPTAFQISNDPNSFLLMPRTQNWCWVWRRIYKRELLDGIRFQPEFTGMGDDLCFMVDVCWRAKKIAETINASVYHRYHSESLTEQKYGVGAFEFFPHYFKYIRDKLQSRYDTQFLRRFYHATMPYLLRETLILPSRLGRCREQATAVLKESIKYIPRHYLYWRYRFLFWLLRWVK